MTDKSIIIIGGGVSGLCTGIYGQMNGYQTRILEMHDLPGGLATAWKRKGYTIDCSVHWLVGSGPGLHLHRYWNEIGLLEGREFVHHDRYMTYQGSDGRLFHLYCDPERLEKHMLALAPQDASAIQAFISGLRFGISFSPPEVERYELGPLGGLKIAYQMFPKLGDLQKWMKVSLGELALRFQDPLIRGALMNMWLPDFSALLMFMTLGYLYKQQAGYPTGGSLPLARFLEKRYQALGGQMQYRSRVEKVLVENHRAVGVRLADGREQRGDVVISAADGYTTIFEMLDGQYVDQAIREQYRSWKTFPPLIYAGIGVNQIFPEVPASVSGLLIELKKPVVIAGKERQTLSLRVHNTDPSFAPPGKTVLVSALDSDYEYWKPLLRDRQAYVAEKDRTIQALIGVLEQQWPGICARVEMCNVATPLTFERFTGNWRGSYEGWLPTPEHATAEIRKNLPGLENFWMVGQWVYPGGGLPGGVATGREIIWRQCRQDGKVFRTASD